MHLCMCRQVWAIAPVTASLPRLEFARNLLLTLSKASSGQSENQSMVQQLIRDGNWRHLHQWWQKQQPGCWQYCVCVAGATTAMPIHCSPRAESIPDGCHGEHDVQVVPHSVDEG